jgi:hypothetical protein
MSYSQMILKGGCTYALADPHRLGLWRYIAQSFRPVARRTLCPSASRRLRPSPTANEGWIAGLLSNGWHARVVILERDVLPSELSAVERAWIGSPLKDGYPLTNALLYRRRERFRMRGNAEKHLAAIVSYAGEN